jgi:two-component system chemotaxis response regulator CheB
MDIGIDASLNHLRYVVPYFIFHTMKTHDIIVVGASAGGVEALREFVKHLPINFAGSVFVVLHIPPYSESRLPEILSAAGPLTAIHPRDGEYIKPGIIYIAPSDHHMLIEKNRVIVKKGPKENRFRPSIDALFRSAAYSYGNRVIGIVLSGMLDDGTSGLWSVKRMGGMAIIQNPHDAQQPQMPQNVLEYVDVDYKLNVADMGSFLEAMAREPASAKSKLSKEELKLLKMEIVIATRDDAFELGIIDMGVLTPFTCPECHGALVRLQEGNLIRFRCHTGHAYTASSLLAEVSETVESILWQGMRGMEEMVMMLRLIADQYTKMKNKKAAALFRAKAKRSEAKAKIIHDSIFAMEQYSEDIRLDNNK